MAGASTRACTASMVPWSSMRSGDVRQDPRVFHAPVRTSMKRELLTARLVRAHRVRSYHVRPTLAGWEASAREDERLVHERSYSDWHRVERTLERFRDEIAELRA